MWKGLRGSSQDCKYSTPPTPLLSRWAGQIWGLLAHKSRLRYFMVRSCLTSKKILDIHGLLLHLRLCISLVGKDAAPCQTHWPLALYSISIPNWCSMLGTFELDLCWVESCYDPSRRSCAFLSTPGIPVKTVTGLGSSWNSPLLGSVGLGPYPGSGSNDANLVCYCIIVEASRKGSVVAGARKTREVVSRKDSLGENITGRLR